MTVTFADTAFYVALLSGRDSLHSRAVQFLTGYSGRIVTSEFVLLEVAKFNSRPREHLARISVSITLERVNGATQRADKLTQAILAKAFRGELVPTEAELARREGRDYDPASVLLERIRTERAAQHGSPARRSPTRPSRKKGRS